MSTIEAERFYQIGEMSKLCGIPIRTLHYYNQIGLLTPERVDTITGYRYYSHSQLYTVNSIKHFKSAGFSLKEIETLLQERDAAKSREMIRGRCEELAREIDTLTILKNRLKLYAEDNAATSLTTEIQIRELPVSYVAYSRYTGPCSPDEFVVRFAALSSLVEQHRLRYSGTMMAIYHDDYRTFDYRHADIEVCVAVAAQQELPGVVRRFGGYLAVTTTHYGSYKTMQYTYKKMIEWLTQNGFEYTGAAIENYIIDTVTTACEDDYVTKLILPVKRA